MVVGSPVLALGYSPGYLALDLAKELTSDCVSPIKVGRKLVCRLQHTPPSGLPMSNSDPLETR